MVISYSCFHFGPKYYRPAASDGHSHRNWTFAGSCKHPIIQQVRF